MKEFFQSGYVYSGLAVTREYHVTLRNHANLGGKNNGQQRIRLSEFAKKLPFLIRVNQSK